MLDPELRMQNPKLVQVVQKVTPRKESLVRKSVYLNQPRSLIHSQIALFLL
jgi:hypothetical protein